jgi:ABC-type antimicrobial peptide transport system permease subunit
VLFLLISFLTSFDNYHPNGDRIYRFVTSSDYGREELDYTPGVAAPFPDAIKSDITGIESVLFISGVWGPLISIEEDGERRIFGEDEAIAYTDSTYFRFFSRKLLSGNASLSSPNEAVISRKWAMKYFGDEDPAGKMILVNNTQEFVIRGVMDDYPENTSFPFDLLMSYETIRQTKLQAGWGSVSSDDQCYVMLETGRDPEDINAQMPESIRKYNGEENSKHMKRWLQPLQEIKHDTRLSNYSYQSVEKESIWAMGVIIVFLIITGCINFINLSTAVAIRRSKEVGIRKVLGSQRGQLVFQYLSETGLVTLFAVMASAGLAELALLRLNDFLELDLHINLSQPTLWIFLGGIWLTVSLISGLYPSFLLSGFSPALALKNKLTNRTSGGYFLRRALVVFQFAISQFLIVGTIILLSQMDYFRSKDLGFTKEAVITIPLPLRDSVNSKMSVLAQVRDLAGVQQVSLCSTPPSSGSVNMSSFEITGLESTNNVAQIKAADWTYLDLFDIELVAGRPFDDVDTANAWIVNERFVQWFNLQPEEILGRNLRMWGRNLPIIGVVKDFHTMSLERPIEPTILLKDPWGYRNLVVKLKPGQFNSTIESIERSWQAQYPDFLFSYEFLDEEIAQFYEDTHEMSVLLIIFCSIAIFISCLGLYGLISYIANQKEKEIGVRKVLGATTRQIMLIFSKEFILLIVIAFFVAAPLSGYVMSMWLENFAYRIPLGWTMFAAGIAATLAIAFVTVGYRSLRAATANPVDALRNE